MTSTIRHIMNGFASLGNFFGDSRPLLRDAPRNIGEAWQRDWQKIGGDFQQVLGRRGMVGDAEKDKELDVYAQLYNAKLRQKLAEQERDELRKIRQRKSFLRKLVQITPLISSVGFIWAVVAFTYLFSIDDGFRITFPLDPFKLLNPGKESILFLWLFSLLAQIILLVLYIIINNRTKYSIIRKYMRVPRGNIQKLRDPSIK